MSAFILSLLHFCLIALIVLTVTVIAIVHEDKRKREKESDALRQAQRQMKAWVDKNFPKEKN